MHRTPARHRLLLFLLLAGSLSGCVVGDVTDPDPAAPTEAGEDDVPGGGGGGGGGGDQVLPAGKLAVVLAHGLDGNRDSFDPSIVAAIEAGGHLVLRTEVPGIESVAVRAAALGPQLDAFLSQTGATRVHIIAHSMGGLDARYAISKLGYATKVASLTTISTPHRGSPLADVALGLTTSSLLSRSDAFAAIVELVGATDPAALDRALFDLSERQAPVFNASVPDAPGVAYGSYAGLSTPNAIDNPNAAAACAGTTPIPAATQPLLVLAQPIVSYGLDRIPNDAIVSVPSATWGTFRGCIAADHLSEIRAATATHDSPAFFKAIVARLAL